LTHSPAICRKNFGPEPANGRVAWLLPVASALLIRQELAEIWTLSQRLLSYWDGILGISISPSA
jgi:hypothetical protein